MRRRDVNARRQPLKNLRKHRQERQNSRFELLPEVRERSKKSKKIDARAYVNEGSLQGCSKWPKPFENPSPKHLKFRSPLDFFSYFCPRAPQDRSKSAQDRSKSAPRAPQERPRAPKSAPRASQERPKSVPRAPRSVPRATKGTPRAEKYAKTRKSVQQPTKTQKNARKRTQITQNNKKRTATTWMGFQCRVGKGINPFLGTGLGG